MILKECTMIYEMGYEISARNHGCLHPNGRFKHDFSHGWRYFGFEETYLCQRIYSHEYEIMRYSILRLTFRDYNCGGNEL
jgi:hypothetical protein